MFSEEICAGSLGDRLLGGLMPKGCSAGTGRRSVGTCAHHGGIKSHRMVWAFSRLPLCSPLQPADLEAAARTAPGAGFGVLGASQVSGEDALSCPYF